MTDLDKKYIPVYNNLLDNSIDVKLKLRAIGYVVESALTNNPRPGIDKKMGPIALQYMYIYRLHLFFEETED